MPFNNNMKGFTYSVVINKIMNIVLAELCPLKCIC